MTSKRRIASLWICDILKGLLPGRHEGWARAVRAEVETMPNDDEAILFALDALRGMAVFVAIQWLLASPACAVRLLSWLRSRITPITHDVFGIAGPRTVGVASAVGAVFLGLGYLALAGAPAPMLAINAAALILGLLAVALQSAVPSGRPCDSGLLTVLMTSTLLATAIAGLAVDGASRWIAIGPVAIQPSLIIIPVMVLMFAHDHGPTSTLGVLIAALALAMQPDRAMAGVLVAGLAVIAIAHRDRLVLVALAASAVSFLVAMGRPDVLPAVPYVDQILYTAFGAHILAGAAVLGGVSLLLVPALHGLLSGSTDRTMSLVFGAIWLSIIAAAALGDYPTPVVGYGGSAILGYLLSLGVLLRSANAQNAAGSPQQSKSPSRGRDLHSSFAPTQPA